MRNLILILVVLMSTTIARAGEIEYVKWDKLPPGCTVVHTAANWNALQKVAKPTIVHHERSGEILFIWTGKNAAGERYFKIATARNLKEKGKPFQTVIIASKQRNLPDATLPLMTIPVTDHKRNEKQVERTPWARQLSQHKELGTLYEVAFYVEPCCCGAIEQRLLLMHSPKNGWQCHIRYEGDATDDVSVRTANAEVTWTPHEYSPFKFVVRYEETQPEATSRALMHEERYGDDFSGPYKSDYIIVKAGDTFSGIVKDLVDWDLPATSKRARAEFREWLSARLVQLNQMKGTDVIHKGKRLEIPSGEERSEVAQKIFTEKGAN